MIIIVRTAAYCGCCWRVRFRLLAARWPRMSKACGAPSTPSKNSNRFLPVQDSNACSSILSAMARHFAGSEDLAGMSSRHSAQFGDNWTLRRKLKRFGMLCARCPSIPLYTSSQAKARCGGGRSLCRAIDMPHENHGPHATFSSAPLITALMLFRSRAARIARRRWRSGPSRSDSVPE